MSNFIEVYEYNSNKYCVVDSKIHINVNSIIAFSKVKEDNKDCLKIRVDRKKFERQLLSREYVLCKEDNPSAYKMLLR
jgi:hypothetical protein